MASKRILITRPAAQAEQLCAQLRERGLQIDQVPVMEIAALDTPEQQAKIEKLFSRITSYHGIILVSVNAAELVLPWLEKFPHARTTKIFSVGKSTATYYNAHHVHDSKVIYPKQEMSSEGLLALSELQADTVKGKRFLIVRGSGGREVIAQILKERGAHVDSGELYRRYVPEQNAEALKQALSVADLVLVNSAESLDNLLALARTSPQPVSAEILFEKNLVVPGERVASVARTAGFRHIIVAANATDEAVLTAIEESL